MIQITRHSLLLILISGFIAFQPALFNQFCYDDVPQVAGLDVPSNLSDWLSAPARPWWPTSHEKNIWRPLTRISILAQKAMYPGQAWTFYLINILMHCLTGYLLFRVALKIGFGASSALLGSLIFTVHPLHSEAVHQVVGRAEILACCWILLGCLCYASNPHWRHNIWMQPICFALALCSKESAVIYPLITGLICLKLTGGYTAHENGRQNARSAWNSYYATLALHLVILAVFLRCKHVVTGGLIEPSSSIPEYENILATMPFEKRLPAALGIFGYASSRLILPIQLAPDYSSESVPLGQGWDWGWSWAGFVLILLVTTWCIRNARQHKSGWMLFLAGLLSWLLTSNLAFVIGVSMAERLWYFPSACACLGLGWLVARLLNQPNRVLIRYRSASKCILIILLIAGSWNYAPAWRNPFQLARWTVDRFPESWRGNINLSREYYHLRDFEAGLRHARKAIRLQPSHALGWDWIGLNATFINDRQAEADPAFLRALELGPDLHEIHRHRSNLLQIQGRFAEASKALRKYLSQPGITDREEIARRLEQLNARTDSIP